MTNFDSKKNTNFRDRINELYEEARDRNHKIGRQGFADLIGATRGQVNGWLDGTSRPNFETLKLIAEKAGVTSSWLIGESDLRNCPSVDVKAVTPEAQRDYLVLLDFLKYKYRSEIMQARKKEQAKGEQDGNLS